MKQNRKVYTMSLSALLIAVGILVPMVSPIKIMVGPMSFTLASHVAIMVAIFISPSVAVGVSLGTALGFLLAGQFPIVVVLRALSHVVWAFLGATYLKKYPDTLTSLFKTTMFILTIGLIHAIGEVLVVLPIYLGNSSVNEFIYMVFGLVGFGTLIHSSIDLILSIAVWKVICRSSSVASIANVKKVSFANI
ncbi:MAG: hypothetical protein RSA96_06205 [Erysipelotrichaceae bacterium]